MNEVIAVAYSRWPLTGVECQQWTWLQSTSPYLSEDDRTMCTQQRLSQCRITIGEHEGLMWRPLFFKSAFLRRGPGHVRVPALY